MILVGKSEMEGHVWITFYSPYAIDLWRAMGLQCRRAAISPFGPESLDFNEPAVLGNRLVLGLREKFEVSGLNAIRSEIDFVISVVIVLAGLVKSPIGGI